MSLRPCGSPRNHGPQSQKKVEGSSKPILGTSRLLIRLQIRSIPLSDFTPQSRHVTHDSGYLTPPVEKSLAIRDPRIRTPSPLLIPLPSDSSLLSFSSTPGSGPCSSFRDIWPLLCASRLACICRAATHSSNIANQTQQRAQEDDGRRQGSLSLFHGSLAIGASGVRMPNGSFHSGLVSNKLDGRASITKQHPQTFMSNRRRGLRL